MRSRFADRTGTRTEDPKGPRPTISAFTYMRLDDGAIALSTGDSSWSRLRVYGEGDKLELSGNEYWHESRWTPQPTGESYACTRA
ncbi:MAG TPA: hypothetical protein VHS78_12330 [Candidatus Elarobacter sp.]|nr:hypothetical protein [Candidatus Elarobacter sp.]